VSNRAFIALSSVVVLWLGKLVPGFTGGSRTVALAGYLGALVLWTASAVAVWGLRPDEELGPWRARWLPVGVGLGLGLFLVGGVGYAVSREILGLSPTAALGVVPRGVGLQLALLIGMALVSAVLEEWLFRGVALGALSFAPGSIAAVSSAALFAAYHLSLFQLLPTFLLGVGLAAAVLALGSLWPAIVAHAVFNVVGVLLFAFGGGSAHGG